jgi:hypothetical protein
VAIGAGLRFYGLDWGAPFFHFHIDEHFVFRPADMLRRSADAAAKLPKFFMYSPLPMYLVNGVRSVYESAARPLVLTDPGDEVTYMVMGRAISAALGTATIPFVYLIAKQIAGPIAGVLAAFFLALSVVHLRESHFFTVDISMTFFSVVAWWFLMRVVAAARTRDSVGAGISLGLGVLSKYTAAFLIPLIGLAELLSPKGPRRLVPVELRPWIAAAVRSLLVVALGIATFLLLDPLAIKYYGKFRSDIKEWVTDPLLGVWKPLWVGQFADVNPRSYWVTNLLWWSLGPALEVWALAGLIWLFWRRDRLAAVAAAFPLMFWLAAGQGSAPFIRYAVPLAPPLAVSAAVLSADLMRLPRWRTSAIFATSVVLACTAVWALAYMNVYRQPDARLTASAWLMENVPPGAKVLVEPHHNIPPVGEYLANIDFNRDYVVWGGRRGMGERFDHFQLYSLDVYRYLYDRGPSDEDRRRYIASRVALADWIVMDDTFLQQYEPLPERDHGVVKQYYRDLFSGRLGFRLEKTFKVYPSIFGWTINDDRAELTFRLFDHPRIFIFRRQ